MAQVAELDQYRERREREGGSRGPQLEEGHIKIANELYEAIMAAPLTAREMRVVMAVMRLTYGWNKKQARVTGGLLAKLTGLHGSRCTKVMAGLIEKNVIIRHGGSRSPVSINKHYREWRFEGQKHTPPSPKTEWAESAQNGPFESAQNGPASKDRKDITPKTHVASNATSASPAKPKAQTYPESFEACWKAYPKRHRHDGKKPAFKAWKARIREGIPEATLLLAVKRYADQCDSDDTAGTRFVKMAQTFFGPDEHWRPFAENRQDQDTTTAAPTEAQINLDGRAQYRPLPGCVDQPDDDGFLTFPDGSRWHVSDWDAGRVPQEAWS